MSEALPPAWVILMVSSRSLTIEIEAKEEREKTSDNTKIKFFMEKLKPVSIAYGRLIILLLFADMSRILIRPDCLANSAANII